jgi:hypothetical protein
VAVSGPLEDHVAGQRLIEGMPTLPTLKSVFDSKVRT